MRLLYVIAGSGRMECDACLRDGLLARTFKAKGHDVLFAPMYTPLPEYVGNRHEQPLFFGGINVFLQQKLPLFRRTPRLIDKFFDSPALLDFVSRFGHLTQASDLADLTVSVLEGEDGNQRKELEAMLAWLVEQPRPDAIILPNSLLAGLAEPLRRRLGAPVFCLLSGEDMFIDQFPEPHRARTLAVLRRRAREIDGFLAPSAWYAEFMADYLAVEPSKIQTMVTGIDTQAYLAETASKPELFTIGYRSQINPLNGLHILAAALRILKADSATAACRVRAAGHLAPGDKPYLKQIQDDIAAWGLSDSFDYVGELSPAGRIGFLKQLSVFTVPAVYPEPTGLYVPESLAAGAPVILPRAGCLPEWIEQTGGGLLIDSPEPEPLAEAIGRLMRDPSLASQLAESGHAAVHRDNTLSRMADSTLHALSSFST